MRIWQGSDFVGNSMPTKLDTVSATVNGKPAFVYYISPLQVNILTPPDALSGPAQVEVTYNGVTSAAFTAPAQSLSPSFFVFNGGPYVAATHLNGSLIGPGHAVSGREHSRQAWRDHRALRQRIWIDQRTRAKWICQPVRHAVTTAGSQDWWRHRNRAVRWPGGAWGISLKRGESGTMVMIHN